MQFLAQFAQQMAALFQQMAGNIPVQALVQAPPMQLLPPARQYEKLMKYGEIEVKGTVDQLEAEQWLKRMEKVFNKLHCIDDLKFEYSISLL